MREGVNYFYSNMGYTEADISKNMLEIKTKVLCRYLS